MVKDATVRALRQVGWDLPDFERWTDIQRCLKFERKYLKCASKASSNAWSGTAYTVAFTAASYFLSCWCGVGAICCGLYSWVSFRGAERMTKLIPIWSNYHKIWFYLGYLQSETEKQISDIDEASDEDLPDVARRVCGQWRALEAFIAEVEDDSNKEELSQLRKVRTTLLTRLDAALVAEGEIRDLARHRLDMCVKALEKAATNQYGEIYLRGETLEKESSIAGGNELY